jgi:hypothetical protein
MAKTAKAHALRTATDPEDKAHAGGSMWKMLVRPDPFTI